MTTGNKLLALGIVATLVAAYLYSRRPVVAMLTTGEPEEWATPPGSDLPSPTVAAPIDMTSWRQSVVDSARDLFLAKQSVLSAGGALAPGVSRFVDSTNERASFLTYPALRLMALAIPPVVVDRARNTTIATAYIAFNRARAAYIAALEHPSRNILTPVSDLAARMPDAPAPAIYVI